MTFVYLSSVFTLLAHLLVCSSLSLRIEIAPVEYTEDHSGQVNVTCRMDSTDVDDVDIYVMEIVDNDGQPIVFVRNSGLSFADDYANSATFQAEGALAKNIVDSFLRLSINEPKSKDQGEYTCKIFFLDKQGFLKERRAVGNLTINKIDNNHEVRQLLAEVATLKNELQDRKQTDIELSDKINRLTHTTDKLQNRTDNLEDLAIYTTSFSASLSANVDMYANEVVKFDRVLVNDKNAYNSSTGIFKVPRRGLYAFHLVLMTWCNDCVARVHIKSNDVILASLIAYDDQSSVSCVKDLMEGDLVKVMTFYRQSKLNAWETTSLFSGYLVRPV